MKVVFVARNDGTDMRVSKECNSLLAAGHDVTFVGWRPDPEASLPDPMPLVPKAFNRDRGPQNKALRLLAFRRHVNRKLAELEPEVVQCANEEYTFLALRLRQRAGLQFSVVCDIFDSLGLRMSHATYPLNRIARRVTDYVHRNADHIVVTDERRLGRIGPYRRSASIVANYPVDPGPSLARTAVPSGRRRLFVAGSLSAGRGLEIIQKTLNRRPDFEVLSAGWVYDELAAKFVEHASVDFRGVVTPADALELAASCHAIVALYQPSSENNVLASPNKVYDALCIGRPIVINSETAISQWISEVGAGPVIPYGDESEFERAVDSLPTDPTRLELEAGRLRRIFESGYSWAVAEKALLEIYAALEYGRSTKSNNSR